MEQAVKKMKITWDGIKIKLNTSPMLLSVLVNILVFGVIQICFEPRFETNDDNYMAALLYGSTGEYSSRLIFINVVIGKILKTLLQIMPGVCWYTIAQYVVMFASFVAIFYVAFDVLGTQQGMLVNGILSIFYVYEAYAYIQFSKTAAIAVTAGMVLIFRALDREKRNRWECVSAVILIVIGSMYRFSVFEMLLIIFFGVGVFQCVHALRKKNYRKIARYVLWFAGVFALCFGFHFLDNWAYRSFPEWQEYRSFDSLRANLLDHSFPDYEGNVELYEKLEITPEDLEMYRNWDFADPEKFSKSVLTELIDAKEGMQVEINGSTLLGFFQEVMKGFSNYKYFTGIVIILLLWIVGGKKGKLLVLYEILAIFGIEFYCFCKGKYLISRVDYGFFLAVSVILALLVGRECLKKMNSRYVALFLITIILLNRPIWLENKNTTITQEEQEDKREFFELVNSDKEHLYLASEFTQDDIWIKAFSVYDVVPKGIASNYYVLGGWGYQIPSGKAVLERYQIENPFRDMVDNPNVYLVDNNSAEQKIGYIRRYYSENAYLSWAKEINGVTVYRIVTHEPELDTSDAAWNEKSVHSSVGIQPEGENGFFIQGYLYQEGTDSYNQKMYIGLRNKETGEEMYYDTFQYENEMCTELTEGKYSAFKRYFDQYDMEYYDINLYLENENGMHAVGME